MTIRLFDLAGAEPNRRFSPYCWRTKLALAHKGLTVETIPWRFIDTDTITMSGQGRVPVLLDGDKVVSDSWMIAIGRDALDQNFDPKEVRSTFDSRRNAAPQRVIIPIPSR